MSAALAASSLSWPGAADRIVPPASTVERLRPHLASLGITRLARQTGLDRIGIPCFSAIRPTALTLSVSQGKGADDASAMASALMEAAEFAMAENPQCATRRATMAELEAEGAVVFNPRRLLPQGRRLPPDLPIHWVEGRVWPSAATAWLPFDALTIGIEASDLTEISRSTNGLASGNTGDEALFHAICELIERDATALWSLHDDANKQRTEFSLKTAGDPVLDRMSDDIAASGLTLRLFDQTTDLGVPCVMAVISELSGPGERRFDRAAGYGCHPVGAGAISRAITEAAQTRITNIAGARDDFLPEEYFEETDDSTAFLATAAGTLRLAPAWLAPGTPLPELLAHLAERVGDKAGIAWASLGGERCGISVLRVLSSTLEDREANANWRPGKRALRALFAR
jgi:ribosomal protein S12 methylthiotransferase accessory factor